MYLARLFFSLAMAQTSRSKAGIEILLVHLYILVTVALNATCRFDWNDEIYTYKIGRPLS